MRPEKLLLTVGFAAVLASSALADTFTGPTSPYYLDNFTTHAIYVVQGTSVVNSFAWAYGAYANGNGQNEGTMAVPSAVNTRPDFSGPSGQGGPYNISGVARGVTESSGIPVGEQYDDSYYGTSDGQHNYYVQFSGYNGTNYTEDVYQTDLTWQNPILLFSVPTAVDENSEYLGISYDPTNQSLWIGGWDDPTISDYSLAGTLLSSFNTGNASNAAVDYDAADNTLWLSYDETNLLQQYSTTGALLQSGTPVGLPGGYYLTGDFSSDTSAVQEDLNPVATAGDLIPDPVATPEPTSILLLATVGGAILRSVRGKSIGT